MTPEERRDAIRSGLDDLAPLIVEAYNNRDHAHFGYGSWSEYVHAEFGGPLRLAVGQRREAAIGMRQAGMSYPAIGHSLGVSDETARRDVSTSTNVEVPERIVGLDGKERPATRPEPKPVVHVANNSGNNEWYTPPEYIEAARRALGGIDTDPASSDLAQQNVVARTYYTVEDDGLAHDWEGSVWLNPPYEAGLVDKFVSKLIDEHEAGRVTAAVVLTNNATETRWFQALARHATAWCFPQGRIRYLDATGNPANTPLQGQVFTYLGDWPDGFRSEFTQFGAVMNP